MLLFRPRFLLLPITWAMIHATPVKAQVHAEAERTPVISRMCLWNADRRTWNELGAKRDQVRQLNVIRQRYPAVVEGQWINEPDTTDANEPEVGRARLTGEWTTNTKEAGLQNKGMIGGQPHTPPAGIERIGLQAELREVLTMEQLRIWEQLCRER